MISQLGGYEFTHILDIKRGAVVHITVENNIITEIHNDTGRIIAIKGMSVVDAIYWIRKNMHISIQITQA